MGSIPTAAVVNQSQQAVVGTAHKIPSLDGLRAFSILAVVLSHCCQILASAHGWLGRFEPYGQFGVKVFFVISGFLITSLLIKEQDKTGTVSLSQFYIRRGFRIFPAAYAFILVTTLALHTRLSWGDVARALTYTTDFGSGGTAQHWPLFHLWSLSIEEQFYLIWPFLFLVLKRGKLAFLIGIIVISPIFRVLLYWIGFPDQIDHGFFAASDALASGSLLALLWTRLPSWIESR